MPATAVKDRAASGNLPGCGFFLLLLIAGCAALAGGCAGTSFEELRQDSRSVLRLVLGVPFIAQSEKDCGPAALAGVLRFFGQDGNVEQITSGVYSPALGGTLPMDLVRYVRELGFRAESRSGSMDQIKAEVNQGRPVITLLDLGFGPYRQPHYVTVIGYEEFRAVVIMHDGAEPNRVMSFASFDNAWNRAGRWMLVVQ